MKLKEYFLYGIFIVIAMLIMNTFEGCVEQPVKPNSSVYQNSNHNPV